MAIALDAVYPGSSGETVSYSVSASWSHTCTGSSLVLLLPVGLNSPGSGAPTVTYGSQTLSLIEQQNPDNSSFSGGGYLFGLIAPAAGTNTVTVTPQSGASDIVSGSVSFTGCDQVTGWKNITTNFGSSSGTGVITGTVAGVASGDWAVACAIAANAITSPIDTGTGLYVANLNSAGSGNGGAGNAAMGYQPSSGSQTINWSEATSSTYWAWIGLELIAAAAGPSFLAPPNRPRGQAVNRASTY